MSTLPPGGTFLGTLTNGKSIYSVPVSAGYQLWGTDGTADGAQDLFSYSADLSDPLPQLLSWGGNAAIIVARHDSSYSLYWTDGSAGGTQDFLDLSPAFPDSTVGFVTAVNGRAIIYTRDGQTNTFYGTDGTSAGTHELFQTATDYLPSVGVLSSDGTTATLAIWGVGGQSEIYTTDGTPSGTTQTFSGTLDVQGGADFISVAIAIFWSYAFGHVANPPFWTGVSSDWSGPVVNFIGPPPDWHYGGLFGPVYPNWSDGFLPESGNEVTIDQPGVLYANIPTSIYSLKVGFSSILNITSSMSVATDVTDLGAIYVNGGLTVGGGGTISVGDGAIFQLAGGGLGATTLLGVPNATIGVPAASSSALSDTTIAAGTTFAVGDGAYLNALGTIVNDGLLTLTATSSDTRLDNAIGNAPFVGHLLFTGSGTIRMSGVNTLMEGRDPSYAVIDADQTVRGSGRLSRFSNQGTIIADQPDALTLYAITNTGTILATAGGSLVVDGIANYAGELVVDGTATITSSISGGTISVGDGAIFQLAGGGLGATTLLGVPSATIGVPAASSSALSDTTIAAGTTFAVGDGAYLNALGTIVNDGLLTLTATSSDTRLDNAIGNAPFVGHLLFTGSGTIRMSGVNTLMEGRDPSYAVIDADQTVRGSGRLSRFSNQGTIIADQPDALTLYGITNTGTILATAGGSLVVESVGNNTNAVVAADGGTVTIQSLGGGYLRLQNAGTLQVSDTSVSGTTIDFADGPHDTLVLTAHSANFPIPIGGLGEGDRIELPAISVASASVSSPGTITVTEVGGATLSLTNIAFDTGAPQVLRSGHNAASGNDYIEVACFVTGTRLLTDRGEVPVERLREGDLVATIVGQRFSPVRWIGHRAVNLRKHARPWDVQPVRVRAHAFGPNQPHADLLLSPDHAVYIDGVLIPVRYLLNGATVVQEDRGEVTYWHVELNRHDVLLAHGLPVESYLDTGNRTAFSGAKTIAAHPDFARATWSGHGCAPLEVGGPRVAAAKQRSVQLAQKMGYALTDNPRLRVVANGQPLSVKISGSKWLVRLPPHTRTVKLVSNVWTPAHTPANGQDTRSLGVAIADIRLDGEIRVLGHPSLGPGWHAPERNWRWTSGNAELSVAGASVLTFNVALAGSYWEILADANPKGQPLRQISR